MSGPAPRWWLAFSHAPKLQHIATQMTKLGRKVAKMQEHDNTPTWKAQDT
jgi:hypothetical protein